jgi:hypothetical protein
MAEDEPEAIAALLQTLLTEEQVMAEMKDPKDNR